MKIWELIEELERLPADREVFVEHPERRTAGLVEPVVSESQRSDPRAPSVYVVIK